MGFFHRIRISFECKENNHQSNLFLTLGFQYLNIHSDKVVCVVAQIILIREELMNSERPNTLLRTLPNLNTNSIISLSMHLISLLPESLYQQLLVHCYQSKSKVKRFNTMPRQFFESSKQAKKSANAKAVGESNDETPRNQVI